MKFYIFLSYCLCFSIGLNGQNKNHTPFPKKINANNITIARDAWGVPHIFAKTDAEVAYGLAWANAEDAFDKLQEMAAIAKGKMGILKGKDGAKTDFFVQAIGARKTVDSLYHTLDKNYLIYLDAYCQGLNAYAAQFPEKVAIKKLFPIQDKDMLTVYLACFAFLSGAPLDMQKIMDGKFDKLQVNEHAVGSNAYAFNGSKTTDRKTYLCINPHFFIEGPLSFYEAHLQSEEGLNITGALFNGGASIFLGNNMHLGWAHTYNYIDQVDIFALDMKGSSAYILDEKVHKLEKIPIRLKVKMGAFTLPIRKKVYRSAHGIVFQSKDKKFYAMRSPSFENIAIGQQYYAMNKANNFEEFTNALKMNALNMFNIIYADNKDNIYYLCNGRIPKRNPKYDYTTIIQGNKSEAIWTDYYTIKDLPQVKNPYSGYVFNTNNTPSHATGGRDNYPKEQIQKYIDLRPGDNNRALRFINQIEGTTRLNFDEFKALKFDQKISKETHFFKTLSNLYSLDIDAYPHLSQAIELMQNWDGNTDTTSIAATLFFLTLEKAFDTLGYTEEAFIKGVQISDELLIECIEHASAFLLKHYGSIKVPYGRLIYHLRNGKLHPALGFPDALVPAYAKHYKDGKYKIFIGDTYIHFVKFGKDGAEKIETLLPFKNNPTSDNYQDELKMLHEKELKTMSLDKLEIMKSAVKIYSPLRQNNNE